MTIGLGLSIYTNDVSFMKMSRSTFEIIQDESRYPRALSLPFWILDHVGNVGIIPASIWFYQIHLQAGGAETLPMIHNDISGSMQWSYPVPDCTTAQLIAVRYWYSLFTSENCEQYRSLHLGVRIEATVECI